MKENTDRFGQWLPQNDNTKWCKHFRRLQDLSTMSPWVYFCEKAREEYRRRNNLKEGDPGYWLLDTMCADSVIARGCDRGCGNCPYYEK